MLTLLITMILVFASSIFAKTGAEAIDGIVADYFDKLDCEKRSRRNYDRYQISARDCTSGPSIKKDVVQFEKISETILFTELAKKEKPQLQCSLKRWEDLSQKSLTDQKLNGLVDAMNAELENLDLLSKAINRLSAENSSLPLKYKNDPKLRPAERVEKRMQDQKQFSEDLEFLMTQYDLTMAKIPLSQNPMIKSFIESKLSLRGTVKPISAKELQTQFKKVHTQVKEDAEALDESLRTNKFSMSQEEGLVSNTDVFMSVLNEKPELSKSLFDLQCQVEKRETLIQTASVGATVVTTVLSGGASMLGRATQMAFLAKNTNAVLKSATWAKTLSYASTALGGAQGAAIVYHRCSRDLKNVKPSCELSQESIEEDRQFASCLQAASLAVGVGAAQYARFTSDKYKELAQFLEKRKQQRISTKNNKLAKVENATDAKSEIDQLSNFITLQGKNGRVEAEILNRTVTVDGKKIYEVSIMGPGGIQKAKLTEDQLKNLKPAEAYSLEKAQQGVQASELHDEAAWAAFFERKTTPPSAAKPIPKSEVETVKYNPDPKDVALPIIKRPEPPSSSFGGFTQPSTSGQVHISELGSNKATIMMTNKMGQKMPTQIEVVGTVPRNGQTVYEVKIFDKTRPDVKIDYMTKEELLRTIPPSMRNKSGQ